MHANLYFAVTAVSCHLLLGIIVFLTNPRRSINRSFLLMTLVVGGWIGGIQLVFFVRDPGQAVYWLRLCSAWGSLTPAAFVLLRHSILHHDETWAASFGGRDGGSSPDWSRRRSASARTISRAS